MSRHRERSRRAGPLAFGAALAVLLALPAGAAWDGQQRIRLGDTVSSEFVGEPGAEVHRISFYAPETTKVSATLTPAKGSGLVAAMTLVDIGDDAVPVGVKDTSVKLTNCVISTRGNYALQVASTTGAGEYTLKTKAIFPRLFKSAAGTYAATAASGTNLFAYTNFDFGALKGSKVRILVKADKGSAATPVIAKITGPAADLTLTGLPAGSIYLPALPGDGTYRVKIEDSSKGVGAAVVAADTFSVVVTVTPPKTGRTYSLPAMEPSDPSNQRAEWLSSGHADRGAYAFTDWNDAIPAVIPTSCARCHSGGGFEQYVTNGSVTTAQPAGARTVDCDACHAPAAVRLTSVTFPSGKQVGDLGHEAICMTCHQGRESTVSVDAAIAAAIGGVPGSGDDTVFPSGSGAGKLGFKNIHYFAAGATLYGRQAQGAYEYPDAAEPLGRKPYDAKFAHVASRDTCLECHDQHSLEVKIDTCATCHVKGEGASMAAVATLEDLEEIRMAGTTEDYDGDGDEEEGVYHEISGMKDVLYTAIRAYAADPALANQAIVYDAGSYPYWFKDVDGDGVKDTEDTSYASWTPRLLRAAYNYQFAKKDTGGFAHNAKYVIAILYDSIADIHAVKPVATFDALHRNDANHFDQAALPWRDWDSPTTNVSVPSSCSRCHTAEGFKFAVERNVRNQTVNAPANDGMVCESCHVEGANFSPLGGNKPARFFVTRVTFPYADLSTSSTSTTAPSTGTQINAVTISNGSDVANRAVPSDDSFICMTCHQGRQSKLTLDAYVATRTTPTTQQTMSFQNVHYFPAGGVQYSTKAAVGYAWTGISDSLLTAFNRTYQGPWTHMQESAWTAYTGTPPADTGGMPSGAQCTYCHMQDGSHKFEVEAGGTCLVCHSGNDVTAWRKGTGMTTDFDGDAATVKLPDEEKAFETALLKALNTYAVRKGKTRIAYNPDVNSYFFKDANGDGVADGTDSANRYAEFDKYMLFGAHEMQMAHKDPGSWAHNGRYILQLMYDAIDYLDDEIWNNSPVNGTTGSPLVRPTTTY